MFQICDLENVGQDDIFIIIRLQYTGRAGLENIACNSMANINLCKKSHLFIFRWISSFSRYSHFKIRDLENVDHSHDVQHSRWRHSMPNT